MIYTILMILSIVLLRSCSSLVVINRSVRMSFTSSSQEASTSIVSRQRRILCYGDSLTAGTSPPFNQLFPYGPFLETELNTSKEEEVVVRWRGLPGWTSQQMVDCINDSNIGLQSSLDGICNPSLSIVIILAGTNDIGQLTSSFGSTNYNIDAQAVQPIIKLHKTCLNSVDDNGTNKNIHTIAIGIPSSEWQVMNQDAATLCNDINKALQQFSFT